MWVAFLHWSRFPLDSDLGSLSHHHYPDNLLLVSLPTSCFHFFHPFFLHNSGTGKGVIKLQRTGVGFLPCDSNVCSCKAGESQSLQLCSAGVWCDNVGITEKAAAKAIVIIPNPVCLTLPHLFEHGPPQCKMCRKGRGTWRLAVDDSLFTRLSCSQDSMSEQHLSSKNNIWISPVLCSIQCTNSDPRTKCTLCEW